MRSRLELIVLSMVAVAFGVLADGARAATDFSMCDGLKGAAWGLCHGGIAAGCDAGANTSAACVTIGEEYVEITGQQPPWVEPPPTCPCAFADSVPFPDDQNYLRPWDQDKVIYYNCGNAGRFIQYGGYEAGPPYTGMLYDTASHSCDAYVEGTEVLSFTDMSDAEAAACREELVDYADAWLFVYDTALYDYVIQNSCVEG